MPSNFRHTKVIQQSRALRPTFFMVYALWIIFCLAVLITAIFLTIYNYTTCTAYIALIAGKSTQVTTLRRSYLSASLFQGIRVGSWLVFVFFVAAYHYLPRLVWLFHSLKLLSHQLIQVASRGWHRCTRFQKNALLLSLGFIAISRICYSTLFALQYDEAFAYIYLIEPGTLVSITYYPGPNNHILFSVIASVFDSFLPTIIALRLPSVLSSLLLWFLLWDWFYSKIRFDWALLLASTLLFLPAVNLYSVMGRGYCLQLLFALISCRALLARYYCSHHRLAFILSATAGFYVIPTYLYWFVALVIYKSGKMVQSKNKQVLKQWLFDLALVGLLTLLLYSPIILFNGLGAVTNNTWVQALTLDQWWTQLPSYLTTVNQVLFGDLSGQWFGLIYFIGLLIYTFFYVRQPFFLLSLLIPWCLILWQRVLPPARIWLFLTLPLGLLISESLARLKQEKFITYIMLTIIFLFFTFTTTQQWLHNAVTPLPHINFSKRISHQPNKQKVFVNHDTYAVFLQYMNLNQDSKHRIDQQWNRQINYDWWVLAKPSWKQHAQLLRGYRMYYEDKEVIIFYKQSQDKH